MKKMYKRAMALCLTAALCSGLLSGCGGAKDVKETQQEKDAADTQSADTQTADADICVEKVEGISDAFIRGIRGAFSGEQWGEILRLRWK